MQVSSLTHFGEIKLSKTADDAKSVKGFRAVEGASLKLGASLLLCLADAVYPIKDGVYAAPIAGAGEREADGALLRDSGNPKSRGLPPAAHPADFISGEAQGNPWETCMRFWQLQDIEHLSGGKMGEGFHLVGDVALIEDLEEGFGVGFVLPVLVEADEELVAYGGQ